MSILQTFPFDNPSNYNLVNSEVSGGKGRLDFINKSPLQLIEDFDDDTGFTYDNAKTEFVGTLMRQKDARPPNATFYANYTNNQDGVWGDGNLNGTLVGGAVVSAGKLDVSGAVGRYSEYDANSNAGSPQTGCIRFVVIPGYTGLPPDTFSIFCSEAYLPNNLNNELILYQSQSTGKMIFRMRDAVAATIFSLAIPNPNFVSGTPVEIELNWNLNTGLNEVYKDGVLVASNTTTGTRGSSINVLRVGAWTKSQYNQDFQIEEFIYFDQPQHTANYTPGQAITDFAYLEDTITLPDLNYTGVGSIQSLNNLLATIVGAPKFIIEGSYWNGSSWVTSDDSYSQANDISTVNTNIAALNVIGETLIVIAVVFPDTNILSSIDDLDLTYTGQEYPLEGTIETNNIFIAKDFPTDVLTVIKNTPVNTDMGFIINVNGLDFYYDGNNWVLSDCTFAQSNTESDVNLHGQNVLTANANIKIKVVLKTTDQDITPEIDTMIVKYDFGALSPAAPNQCQVYGFLIAIDGSPMVGATLTFDVNRDAEQYKEGSNRIIGPAIKKVTDNNGFFSTNLLRSSEFETEVDPMKYKLSIVFAGAGEFEEGVVFNGGEDILFEVPDLAEVNITDQITAS